ncbi:MAG: aminotransferase class IV [Deltaproteobacteria bacterium]|nr:aminotransferase class IV [Deltaproteobacteria bacterium]
MTIRLIHKKNFFQNIATKPQPWQSSYLSMYSSQWQGITTDPDLMVIPIDDHLVHRGDGGFDVMRCVQGRIYQREEHLGRLEQTARSIALELPDEYAQVRALIEAAVVIGGEKECLIRITLSRGPGSFSANPYDAPSSRMYINVIRFKAPSIEFYRKGATLITSKLPSKSAFFASIKSCNYLPNALMKKEAIDAGADYAVALDEDGFLAEGSTENIGVVGKDGILRFPQFDRTLSGTTAKRVFDLANGLKKRDSLKGVAFADIAPRDAYEAREIFMTGTSLNVLPVVEYDGRRIGDGKPGPVFEELTDLLIHDMTKNHERLTKIDWTKTFETQ